MLPHHSIGNLPIDYWVINAGIEHNPPGNPMIPPHPAPTILWEIGGVALEFYGPYYSKALYYYWKGPAADRLLVGVFSCRPSIFVVPTE